jgi:hypothetical protein
VKKKSRTSAWRLSMSSTMKMPEHIVPAYNLPKNAATEAAEAAGLTEAVEAAEAVEAVEAAEARQAAEGRMVCSR